MWRPEATSVRGWREATIFLGRIPSTFQIRLNSQRSEGQRGDVAVDQLEFLDCALPCKCPLALQTFYTTPSAPFSMNSFSSITTSVPVVGKECPAGTIECRREGCVAEQQVCDGTDDCGDGTDEENCGELSASSSLI